MSSAEQRTTPAASLVEPYGASQQGNYVPLQYNPAHPPREDPWSGDEQPLPLDGQRYGRPWQRNDVHGRPSWLRVLAA